MHSFLLARSLAGCPPHREASGQWRLYFKGVKVIVYSQGEGEIVNGVNAVNYFKMHNV